MAAAADWWLASNCCWCWWCCRSCELMNCCCCCCWWTASCCWWSWWRWCCWCCWCWCCWCWWWAKAAAAAALGSGTRWGRIEMMLAGLAGMVTAVVLATGCCCRWWYWWGVGHRRLGDNTWGAPAGVIGSAGLRLMAVDEMVMDFIAHAVNQTYSAFVGGCGLESGRLEIVAAWVVWGWWWGAGMRCAGWWVRLARGVHILKHIKTNGGTFEVSWNQFKIYTMD